MGNGHVGDCDDGASGVVVDCRIGEWAGDRDVSTLQAFEVPFKIRWKML
jgi:hypothetical protein